MSMNDNLKHLLQAKNNCTAVSILTSHHAKYYLQFATSFSDCFCQKTWHGIVFGNTCNLRNELA